MQKKSLYIIATLAFALVLLPVMSRALTLTPTSKEVTLTPGQKSPVTIELKNETQKALELTAEVVNFTAKGENGEPEFDFNATPIDLATWIEVNPGPFTVAAGATQSVDVVINTPATATAGGYYAAVFFNEFTAAEEPSQVNIESKLGTLFLATVKGSYAESAKIATFQTKDGKTNYSGGPVAFKLRFQNTGDVHLNPSGTVTIKNMFGKAVKTIQINKDSGATLPGSIREYAVSSWSDVGNAFGQYTAVVALTGGTASATKSISFWMISTLGIIITVAVVILLIVLIIATTRRGAKKEAVK